MTCNNIASLHALLRFFSRTAIHNPKMWILAVRNWVPHRSNTGFVILDSRHAFQIPRSSTVPPRPRPLINALSRAQRKRKRASRYGPLRWGITRPICVQNSPNVREMSAMLMSSSMPIFSYFPKIPLFQKHQRSRRDMDPLVFKLPASRGRDT